jgi:hypothetical protein
MPRRRDRHRLAGGRHAAYFTLKVHPAPSSTTMRAAGPAGIAVIAMAQRWASRRHRAHQLPHATARHAGARRRR